MKRTLFIGMLGLSALMSGYAQQGEGVRKGRIVREPLVHDPVMAKEGDTYYLYSTGHNVSSFSSKDLSEWTIRHSVFSAPPQWAVDSIKGYEGHTWAPDIIYYKGNYHLFYSCSAFGKNTSAIGHAYRRTLSSASDEPWTDTGAVIVSHARDNFNAIDPNIVVDEKGDPWMAFGSFWGGIQLVRLTEDLTSTLKPEKLYTICTRQFEGASDVPSRSVNSVEAPFIFKHGDYYYLFVSYDFCCRGLSGVGISFGADRIFDVLNQLDLYPKETITGTEVLFVNFGATEAAYCMSLLTKVRAAGIRSEIYPDTAKMKKQMAYANAKQVPYVVLVGENEMNEGKLTLKNMTTGEQQLLSVEEMIAVLRS